MLNNRHQWNVFAKQYHMNIQDRTIEPVLPDIAVWDFNLIRSKSRRISKIVSVVQPIGLRLRVELSNTHEVLLRRQSCLVNTLERLQSYHKKSHWDCLPQSTTLSSVPTLITIPLILTSGRSRITSESGKQLQVNIFKLPLTNHHTTPNKHNNTTTSPWSP